MENFMIYLASNSPRRRELLDQIGVPYQLLLTRARPGRPPDINESPLDDEPPLVYVQRLAHIKALSGWERAKQRALPFLPLLAADTTVALDHEILGKPEDENEAIHMLRMLSGRSHLVHTAITMVYHEHIESIVSTTEVTFHNLSDDEICQYIEQESVLDKAGSYGLQGRAAAFIKHLSGSDSGVKGLPLYETAQLLRRFNVSF
jgi:septum formation protein